MEDMEMKDLEDLLNQLKMFKKMYNLIRIVDPVNKKVLQYAENELREEDIPCYEFWKRQSICDNCISIRAYIEGDTFIKVENKIDSIYMVTAVPIVLNNRKLVVELLKNVTESFYIGDGLSDMGTEVYSLIKGINHIAIKDALTGIYNRRYINERLPVEIISSSIHHIPLSVIFADLDHFKYVNDANGHLTGDMVLKKAAGVMAGCIDREKDWAARYGGEEFLFCLPGTDNEAAIKIAGRMRKEIEEKEFEFEEKVIRITASFGVYTIDSVTDFFSMEDLMKSVDDKLYQAKNEGRNKVV